MISMAISEISQQLGGRLIGEDVWVSNIYTDSRNNCADALFIALKGPHFDAHNFLSNVKEQGAKAILVEQESVLDIPQIIVKDTRKALGELAKLNRTKISAKCVAITGSSGKTTVKEMLAAILSNAGKTHATVGNLNNEIGVPLTLLQMDDSYQFAVVELGANKPGEIAYTASLAKPDVALINNVAAAHLEGFGDLQGVARAKGEIYSELSQTGIAVINNDDNFSDYWKRYITTPILTYSTTNDADVTANNIQLDEQQVASFTLSFKQEICQVKLNLAGIHNVSNALAAATCAIALGCDLEIIAQGLNNTPLVKGRLVTDTLANGCRIIDDTYNANLESMRAAIKLLQGFSSEKILVIGDMAELGEAGRRCHEEIGDIASNCGIDKLYSCGVLTKFSHGSFSGYGKHFVSQQELIKQLKQEAKANTTILVKGSRSAHMEKVIQALKEGSNHESQRIASDKEDI